MVSAPQFPHTIILYQVVSLETFIKDLNKYRILRSIDVSTHIGVLQTRKENRSNWILLSRMKCAMNSASAPFSVPPSEARQPDEVRTQLVPGAWGSCQLSKQSLSLTKLRGSTTPLHTPSVCGPCSPRLISSLLLIGLETVLGWIIQSGSEMSNGCGGSGFIRLTRPVQFTVRFKSYRVSYLL